MAFRSKANDLYICLLAKMLEITQLYQECKSTITPAVVCSRCTGDKRLLGQQVGFTDTRFAKSNSVKFTAAEPNPLMNATALIVAHPCV